MSTFDPTRLWLLNNRLLLSVLTSVAPAIGALGLEVKELFLLGELEKHPYPAELASTLCMPKPTVTVYVKRLEKAGFVRREIDAGDLRRHRLLLTPAGRKAMTRGLVLLAEQFGARLERLTEAERATLQKLLEKLDESRLP